SFPYYSYDKIYSYNAAFMFVIGARGLGKTYGAKKKVINNYLKNGEEFTSLRRYNTELKDRATFFSDIQNEYPDYMFRVHGSYAQMAEYEENPKKAEWETIGYFVSLSTAQSKKSVAYPAVTTIIYDEFIIEKGSLRYLPNEARAFNEFYSTVDRWQDKTRVLFLANAVSIMNPFFLEYDIKPDQVGEFAKFADGFIATHFADSKHFASEVYKTRFGKFIKDTEYATFSVGSQFGDNHERMLSFKPSNAKYYCSIETLHGTFSLWVDYTIPLYYVQDKRPKDEILYTFMPEKMDNDKILLSYSDKVAQYLRSAFKTGKVFFSSPQSRNAFVELFKR